MENYFTNKDKTMCYGCCCCQYSCPAGAIEMQYDEEGFLYPQVHSGLCTQCGLCKKLCPFTAYIKAPDLLDKPLVYAVRNNDTAVISKSSSGGMFSVLVDFVLEEKGLVAGCILDEDFNPVHVVTDDPAYIAKMRGSKYIQSDTKLTFQETEKILKSGRMVLYTGTPCQVAGLKSYLHKEYNKLITLDLICHGVPSNQIFHSYLHWFESAKKCSIVTYTFRDKDKNGWIAAGSIKYTKRRLHKKKISEKNDPYYYHYINNNIHRECCYSCKYASYFMRPGDFSIGDFWNIFKYHPDFYSQNGVSLVIVHTRKAEVIFKSITHCITSVESKTEWALKANTSLCRPSPRPKIRDRIYKEIKEDDFGITKKYIERSKNLLWNIKRAIPVRIKLRLKSYLKYERTSQ